MTTLFQRPEFNLVKALLIENQLPVDDLSESTMAHFFGCGDTQNLSGVIGFEVHGTDGLLRSLAVAASARGQGLASALVQKLEAHARSVGVDNLYLLTNTAEEYFSKKGYSTMLREQVPETIRLTKEFSELCPASAVVMRKRV